MIELPGSGARSWRERIVSGVGRGVESKGLDDKVHLQVDLNGRNSHGGGGTAPFKVKELRENVTKTIEDRSPY